MQIQQSTFFLNGILKVSTNPMNNNIQKEATCTHSILLLYTRFNRQLVCTRAFQRKTRLTHCKDTSNL